MSTPKEKGYYYKLFGRPDYEYIIKSWGNNNILIYNRNLNYSFVNELEKINIGIHTYFPLGW